MHYEVAATRKQPPTCFPLLPELPELLWTKLSPILRTIYQFMPSDITLSTIPTRSDAPTHFPPPPPSLSKTDMGLGFHRPSRRRRSLPAFPAGIATNRRR
jgi:hypothetical protein